MDAKLLSIFSDEFVTGLTARDAHRCPLVSSVTAWQRGDANRAFCLAAEAATSRRDSCHRDCSALSRIWYAQLLVRVRDLPAAEGILNDLPPVEGEGIAIALGVCRAELALASGDAAAAVDEATAGAEHAGRLGVPILLPNIHLVLAIGAVRRSDMVTALRYARLLGEDALIGRTFYVPGQSVWAVAQAFEADGGPSAVRHLVERLIVDDRLGRELLAGQPAAAAWLVRVARRLGDERLAERGASRAEALARESQGFRSLRVAALHAGGLVERNPAKLRLAAELHLDRWAAASAAEDHATVLADRQTAKDRSVALLKQAARVYEEVGAPRDAARVASRLRDLGVRSRRPVRRDGRRVGTLTDTELAVAEMVSRGLTNVQVGRQLYISANTVAFHLKKIFRKLEVSSRVELASAWATLTAERADHVDAC